MEVCSVQLYQLCGRLGVAATRGGTCIAFTQLTQLASALPYHFDQAATLQWSDKLKIWRDSSTILLLLLEQNQIDLIRIQNT